MDNVFFCYSDKLQTFLRIFGFRYKNSGRNSNTHKQYWTYEKTDKLLKALTEWDRVKKELNPYESE